VAAELRRGRLGDAVHGAARKRHLGDPYLAAKLQSGTKEPGRWRRHGSNHGDTTRVGGGAGNLGFGSREAALGLGAREATRWRRLRLNRRAEGGWLAGPRPIGMRRPDSGMTPSRSRLSGGGRKQLTRGPRVSAAGAGARGKSACGPRWAERPRWAARAVAKGKTGCDRLGLEWEVGGVCFSFFLFPFKHSTN
jgi:hypothetical protein